MRHLSVAQPQESVWSAHARQALVNHLLLRVVTLAGNRGPVCFCVWFLSIP